MTRTLKLWWHLVIWEHLRPDGYVSALRRPHTQRRLVVHQANQDKGILRQWLQAHPRYATTEIVEVTTGLLVPRWEVQLIAGPQVLPGVGRVRAELDPDASA